MSSLWGIFGRGSVSGMYVCFSLVHFLFCICVGFSALFGAEKVCLFAACSLAWICIICSMAVVSGIFVLLICFIFWRSL